MEPGCGLVAADDAQHGEAAEFGGLTMLRIVRGHQPATGFQKSFARAR